MKFTKMHGIGNDYVYVNGFEERVADPAKIAIAISDRHFGVGGDGLVLILPSEQADVRMRMFNADGSEAEMCGNAVRCVAKYAYEHGLSRNNPMRIQTGRGVLTLALDVSGGRAREVTVNMGHPVLPLADIPVDPNAVDRIGDHEYAARGLVLPVEVDGSRIEFRESRLPMTFVSMGNPHAVIFADDVSLLDLSRLGPAIENHKAFPRRINVHWAKAQSSDELTMRTWERGSGITLACGTGACAVCVAGVLTGRTGRKVLAHLPGGDLRLEWRETDNNVYMTGPATEVFTGEWSG